jgi:hypothetical protein
MLDDDDDDVRMLLGVFASYAAALLKSPNETFEIEEVQVQE